MATTITKSGQKMIVFDQKADEAKRKMHMKMHDLAKKLRDNGDNVYRCIAANLDVVASKLFNIKENDTTKFVVDVTFNEVSPEKRTDEYCKRAINNVIVALMKQGQKPIKNAIFRNPNHPEDVVGKILLNVPNS